MDTRAALWKAICENPFDDLPRLALADWLEETGDLDRATFIRTHIRMSNLPPDYPDVLTLQAQFARLRVQCSERWRAELPRLPGVNLPSSYHRGLFGQALIDRFRQFVRSADELFAALPIQFLSFKAINPQQCEQLVRSPYLGRLYRLNLARTTVGDQGARLLAGCPGLANLGELVLAGFLRSGAGTSVMFSPARLRRGGVLALARSPYLTRLKVLDVSFNGLDEGSLAILRERFGNAVRCRTG